MTPIKIILSLWSSEDGWESTVFRDTATLRTFWDEKVLLAKWEFALIHIGNETPSCEIDQLKGLKGKIPEVSKPVFLTQSAKWGLPQIFSECSHNAVGYCSFEQRSHACGIFLAHRNWGYESVFEPVILASPEVNTKPGYTIEHARDWIIRFYDQHPEEALQLLANEIKSDADYLEKREALTPDLRTVSDNFRFDLLVIRCDLTNPFEILDIAPLWLLHCPVEHIELSVRVANVFRRENILKVGDITRYSLYDLLRMQNFGRKSVETLSQSLLAAYAEYRDQPEMLTLGFCNFDKSENSDRGIGDKPLHSHIEKALSELPRNASQILSARLGFDGNTPLTLQELGDIFGITRERIRQIEKKYLHRLIEKELWDDFMVHRIQKLLEHKDSPLYLEFVGIEDPWFEGFSSKLECLSEVILRFSAGHIHTIDFEGRKIVSKIDGHTFDALVRDIKTTLVENKNSRWSKAQIQEMIQEKLLGFDVACLSDLVWDSVSDNLHFSRFQDEEILTGIGKTAENLVRIVLDESPHPLHYSEVHTKVQAIADRDVEVRRVHSCLALADYAFLFDRGTYGTLKHLRYSEDKREMILRLAEEVIKSGPEEKQWHSSEILQYLCEEDKIEDDLSLYELSIILGSSEDVICLGKNVWVSKFQEGLTNSDRIQINDALIKILERACGPLSTNDLRKSLSEHRGIKANMQINSNDVMIRVSPDHWGLIHRDIPLTREEIFSALNAAFVHLQACQHAIHVSEVRDALSEQNFVWPETIDQYAFHSICATDSRFRIWHGHLIGLTEWQSPRRETASSAIRKAYATIHTPFRLSEIQTEIQRLLGREITKAKLSNALWMIGATYNREYDEWHRSVSEEVVASNDELLFPQIVSSAHGG